MHLKITINNEKKTIEENPNEKLTSLLRNLGLASVKRGCKKGKCGCCTVLLNGKPVPSCKIPVGILNESSNIITLEYFAKENKDYECIMAGFKKAGIQLCGFCNSAKILSVYELIERDYRPKEEELIDFTENLSCDCTERDQLISGIIYATELKNSIMEK